MDLVTHFCADHIARYCHSVPLFLGGDTGLRRPALLQQVSGRHSFVPTSIEPRTPPPVDVNRIGAMPRGLGTIQVGLLTYLYLDLSTQTSSDDLPAGRGPKPVTTIHPWRAPMWWIFSEADASTRVAYRSLQRSPRTTRSRRYWQLNRAACSGFAEQTKTPPWPALPIVKPVGSQASL